jgi:hypothetical protein
MESTGVTGLIPQLRGEGHQAAQEKIWARYEDDLIRCARAVIGGTPAACGNGEEAAASAFMRFMEKARTGELTTWPTDSDSLLEALLRAARCRARDMKRKSLRTHQREATALDLPPILEDDGAGMLELLDHLRTSLPPKTFDIGMMCAGGVTCEDVARAQKAGLRSIQRQLKKFRECVEASLRERGDAQ